MEVFIRPYYIAWSICLIPVIAAHGAFLVGLWEGVARECVPYIEGCTSISRAAREGNAIFLFRGLMMPTAALLIIFWYLQAVWLEKITQQSQRTIFILGATGAIFLVLYIDFLGTSGDIYRLLRRYGTTLYFGLTILAQMLSIRSVKLKGKILDSKVRFYLTLQFLLMVLYWCLGNANIVIKASGVSWADAAENVIEWHFALYMSLYFGLTAMMWQRTGFNLCFTVDKKNG
ncbi:hypothetical protein SAMN06297280_3668 [Arsukibacterium tuosuense]|uniref:Frag1/DRAM/Sfk1 family protein n=2 Tax=Arsukibacterium tuosuense TaxID=1323745 RepID=A0A285JHG2_9GAMM|nr:hypothetical protein SAMN06297280_3668 [Arsukibacterium tuosuense]